MTINEMIIDALTTDSRKRKARYQASLESLGYKIIKDGSWKIRNPKTDRFVELGYRDNFIRINGGTIRFGCIWSCKKSKYVNKPISVIDFKNYLDTPLSDRFIWKDNRSHAEIMRSLLRDRKYHKKNLDNAMAEYQKKINNITAEYQRMLENAKRSYDWNINYHSKAFEAANKGINNLLHKTA